MYHLEDALAEYLLDIWIKSEQTKSETERARGRLVTGMSECKYYDVLSMCP